MQRIPPVFPFAILWLGLLVAWPATAIYASDEGNSDAERNLNQLEAKLMQELAKLPGDPSEARELIEKSVHELFEERLKFQETRLAKAEENLKRIREMLKQRRDSADSIIAKRVDELMSKSDPKAESSDDDSMPASVLATEGWEAWRHQNYRKAIAKFNLALKKEPKNSIAQNGLGWTLFHLQDYDEAIKTFKQLLDQEPKHAAAMNGIGQALIVQGKLDEAEAMLKSTTENLIDEYGVAKAAKMGLASWHGLIRVSILKKDYDSATKWCQRYLEHDPENKSVTEMLDEINKLKKAD